MSDAAGTIPMTEWFDAHLDLAYLAQAGRDFSRPAEALADAAVTFPSLAEGKITRALATVFIQQRVISDDPVRHADGAWTYASEEEAYVRCTEQLAIYRRWRDEGFLCVDGLAGETVEGRAGLRAKILLEGCAGVRSVADLRAFYEAGVRVVSMTWVSGTKYAGGDQSGGGLSLMGRELVREMDDLGIVHDVSHLSEQAFWDLLKVARGRVIASHSNCRVLMPAKKHPERHLSDEQIKALVERGGVIGINLFGKFLVDEGKATIADVVRHVRHMAGLVGHTRFLGLGSDMDGGFGASDLPVGLGHPRELPRLLEALAGAGWGPEALRGFARGNWERFFG